MSSLVVSLFWLLLFVGGGIFLAYQRIDLRTSTIAAGLAVLAYTVFGEGAFLWKLLLWAAFGAMIVPNLIEFRREKITKPLLDVYRKMLPSMSNTEREALEVVVRANLAKHQGFRDLICSLIERKCFGMCRSFRATL